MSGVEEPTKKNENRPIILRFSAAHMPNFQLKFYIRDGDYSRNEVDDDELW